MSDSAASENQDYGAESIKVLRGLDAVRKRPGMYIGDTDDGTGLHHMVFEVVDNAIDEAMGGHCDRIDVTLNGDGSVTVADNGRGIPVDIHGEEGVSAAEVIMTQLHAGGKFDQNSYKVSGGLHGVGVSVVNALVLEWLELTHYRRDGKAHVIRFHDGEPEAPLVGNWGERRAETGTEITFTAVGPNLQPRRTSTSQYAWSTACASWRSSTTGVGTDPADRRPPRRAPSWSSCNYEGGLEAFVQAISTATKTALVERAGDHPRSEARRASPWTSGACSGPTATTRTMLCFTNNIPQRDGGTHLAGFRAALDPADQCLCGECSASLRQEGEGAR